MAEQIPDVTEDVSELGSLKYCSQTKTDEICNETKRILTQISTSNLRGNTNKERDSDSMQKTMSESAINQNASSNLNIVRIPVNYSSPQNHRCRVYPQLADNGSEGNQLKALYIPLSAPPTPPTHQVIQHAQSPLVHTATIWSQGENASPAPSAPNFDEIDTASNSAPKKSLALIE